MTDQLITTNRFVLSQEQTDLILQEAAHYEHPRAAVIEALKLVQKGFGWVPDHALTAVAHLLGISVTEVEEIATFYSQIFRMPVGRHVIRCCDSATCFIAGSDSILQKLQKNLGVTLGETTSDHRFTLLPICCLGHCDKAPSLMIDDDTYGLVDGDMLSDLLDQYP